MSQGNVDVVRRLYEAIGGPELDKVTAEIERFRVEAPGHDSEVEGYAEARALAHRPALELE